MLFKKPLNVVLTLLHQLHMKSGFPSNNSRNDVPKIGERFSPPHPRETRRPTEGIAPTTARSCGGRSSNSSQAYFSTASNTLLHARLSSPKSAWVQHLMPRPAPPRHRPLAAWRFLKKRVCRNAGASLQPSPGKRRPDLLTRTSAVRPPARLDARWAQSASRRRRSARRSTTYLDVFSAASRRPRGVGLGHAVHVTPG